METPPPQRGSRETLENQQKKRQQRRHALTPAASSWPCSSSRSGAACRCGAPAPCPTRSPCTAWPRPAAGRGARQGGVGVSEGERACHLNGRGAAQGRDGVETRLLRVQLCIWRVGGCKRGWGANAGGGSCGEYARLQLPPAGRPARAAMLQALGAVAHSCPCRNPAGRSHQRCNCSAKAAGTAWRAAWRAAWQRCRPPLPQAAARKQLPRPWHAYITLLQLPHAVMRLPGGSSRLAPLGSAATTGLAGFPCTVPTATSERRASSVQAAQPPALCTALGPWLYNLATLRVLSFIPRGPSAHTTSSAAAATGCCCCGRAARTSRGAAAMPLALEERLLAAVKGRGACGRGGRRAGAGTSSGHRTRRAHAGAHAGKRVPQPRRHDACVRPSGSPAAAGWPSR